MRHSTCDIVYAGKELKQGSSRKIVAFFFAMNSGKRFGGLLWKEFIHTSVHLFVALTFLELLITDTETVRGKEMKEQRNPRSANGNLRRKHRARFKAIGGECGICKGRLGPIHYNEPSDSKPPWSFVIDEIKPVSRWREFGYNSREAAAQDWNNLQPAHYCCNVAKRNKTLNEMQRSQKKPKMNVTDGEW